MEIAGNLHGFMRRVLDDPAIGPTHISLYLAILFNFEEQDYHNPISIFSRDLMKQAKISAIGTYYKCINDLKSGGYIRYTPSYNPFLGSLIYILKIES
jgi:hypothetical protein